MIKIRCTCYTLCGYFTKDKCTRSISNGMYYLMCYQYKILQSCYTYSCSDEGFNPSELIDNVFNRSNNAKKL